ncbi:DUF262 domain-containing protein [Amycolatopsis sp. lyj-109]|uniref:GmrSD restriction endonuclease domain-containing protein n=1 Tax=Amycolatopsis sp. lyj-109 TaxID=2789287 RepID=UPI00397DD2FB
MSELKSLPIRKLLDKLHSGQIRIPAFQRNFVWDPQRISHFMDSLYKGYPFGSILLWETQDKLKEERNLGPYRLPEPEKRHPISYVLDGQQRLTSLFVTFQTDFPLPSDEEWMPVYFDMVASESPQRAQFVALHENEVDPERHFPLSCIFDVVRFRQSLLTFSSERHIHAADTLHNIFKEVQIPLQVMETEDRATVAVVFERINRFGVKLTTLELLAAWTWTEEFDLGGQLEELQEELSSFNFGDLAEQPDLILRCAAAILNDSPAIESLLTLTGEDIRTAFDVVKNGIKGAVDFLRDQLHIRTLKTLPNQLIFVPLSVYFAVSDRKMLSHREDTLRTLRKWFWQASFTERYSGQTVRAAKEDIALMKRLRRAGNTNTIDQSLPYVRVPPSYFLQNNFRTGATKTNTFVSMLAQLRPRTFISGSYINVDEVLQNYNKAEFHHIFPRAYVEREHSDDSSYVNSLANFCFLSRVDNNKIRDRPPSAYLKLMPENTSALLDVLDSSAIDISDLLDNDFFAFIQHRARVLAYIANCLMDTGEPPSNKLVREQYSRPQTDERPVAARYQIHVGNTDPLRLDRRAGGVSSPPPPQ